MDQIVPEVEISKSHGYEGLEQQGNSSITPSNEAITINPAVVPESENTVTITHRCESCGHLAAAERRVDERKAKTARQSRRKKPSSFQQVALVDTDSDNGNSDS